MAEVVIFPKNRDYHDRSRLTTPSCDHSRGNLLLERDEWSVGGRRASVDHTVARLQSGVVVFNESDHGRATMVVPANNRRATIAVFNGERRSSIDRALFDILSSDRSLPLTPRLLVA